MVVRIDDRQARLDDGLGAPAQPFGADRQVVGRRRGRHGAGFSVASRQEPGYDSTSLARDEGRRSPNDVARRYWDGIAFRRARSVRGNRGRGPGWPDGRILSDVAM